MGSEGPDQTSREHAHPALKPNGLYSRVGGGLAANPQRRQPPPAGSAARALATFTDRIGQIVHGIGTCLYLEWERGTGFLFVPVFLGIGATIYFSLSAEPGFTGFFIGLLLLALAAGMLGRYLPARLVLSALLLVVVGLLAAKFESWRADTKVLGSEITTRLTGTVALLERRANGRIRLTIDVLRTERPNLRYQPDRIRATTRSLGSEIRPGSGIHGLVKLRPPPGPVRPGGYDFALQNYFNGIGANGFFLSRPEPVDLVADLTLRQRVAILVADLRDRLALRISGSIGGEEGAIAAALITGAKAGIPDEVNEALRRTGLAHILSISGLHMALVAGFVMFVLRAGFALAPVFSSRWPVKKFAAAAALVAVFFYLFISGSGVATQRSFIMLAVMLVALLFDRAAITMRNLAIAAIVVIAIAPHEVIGPSFQMSFAATAALIAAYAAWTGRREKSSQTHDLSPTGTGWELPRTVLRYAGGLAFTSLVAGSATALYAAYHFHRIAPLGLIANLAAMPVVSVAVMPWAVIAVVLMPIGLDGPFLAIMGSGITVVVAIAVWLSERTGFDEIGTIPADAVAVMSIALVLVTLLTTRLRLAAVPFVIAGMLFIGTRQIPDVLISEDGRLLAVRSAGGALAVNRKRPNAFTLNNWKRVLQSNEVLKPASGTHDSNGFGCKDELCLAHQAGGALVVHAKNPDIAETVCSLAAVIVIEDATASGMCAGTGAMIVTKRHLARWGSAAVALEPAGRPSASIRYAISEPYRPWHTHRAFSRASRGLPPWKRKKKRNEARPDIRKSIRSEKTAQYRRMRPTSRP